MRSVSLIAAGLLARNAAAAVQGFASGSTFIDGSAKAQADFEKEFKAAQGLKGAPGTFNSVRLYTNIQSGSTSDPLSAFPAAIATNTSMLLGIWCSGTTSITNELTALKSAISKYGSSFTDLVVGISVGSEDLYRNSVQGVANSAGIGQQPAQLVEFIKQTRSAIAGTSLSGAKVGHVDTWDVWGNSSNSAVLDAIDFVGVDAYPYFESNRGNNSIANALTLWKQAISGVESAIGSKPYFVTETGWPTTGPNYGDAEATVANAKAYWDAVGCGELFGQVDTWWYTIYDSNPVDAAKFAITNNLSTTPLFNLTCPDKSSSSSSSASASASASSSASATGSSASSTSSGSSSSSGSGSGSSSSSDGSPASSGGESTTGSGSSSGSSSSPVTVSESGATAAAVAPASFVALVLAAIATLVL